MRFAVNLGILERPLTQGLLWGAVTGDLHTTLGIAVFFELFWLDQIPAGTYIPPNSLLSTLLSFSLVQFFDLRDPGLIVYPLALSVPFALFGSKIEYFQRRWQDAGHSSLLRWQRRSGWNVSNRKPERLLYTSLVQQFVMNFTLFILGQLFLLGVLYFLMSPDVRKAIVLPISWPHLWFVAALGGMLALRTKRSYSILAAGVGLLTLVSFF